jgi:hypothetical protein
MGMPEESEMPEEKPKRIKHVGTQDWVAQQYVEGRDDVRSQTGNLRAESDGILWHYGTIEAFRDKNGKIVKNSDCYRRGFAYCPSMSANFRLHIEYLREMIHVSEYAMRDIEMVQNNEGRYSCGDKTYYFTVDISLNTQGLGWGYRNTIQEDGKPDTFK